MVNKRQRFEKVATKRVENIIKFMDLLSNCSNQYNYQYDKKDVDKIFRVINQKIKLTQAAFIKNLTSDKFKL